LKETSELQQENFMSSKLRFLDPIVVIGVIISVALAIIFVVMGQDQAISLLIGLTITIITLLIDIIARLKESEKAIIQTSEFGNALASDSWLFDVLRQIVYDYQKINNRNYDAFVRRTKAGLLECRDLLHSMSEEYLVTDILSDYNSGLSGSNAAQKEIKAVQYALPTYWRTPFGLKYMESNIEAVKRGVRVTRIWIQSKEILEEYRDIITTQETAGIQTFIAETSEIPPVLLEDYSITDSQLYIKIELTLDGHARQERISIDPIVVEKADGNFNLLLRYARLANEYFKANELF
jgi:hypothetical protein